MQASCMWMCLTPLRSPYIVEKTQSKIDSRSTCDLRPAVSSIFWNPNDDLWKCAERVQVNLLRLFKTTHDYAVCAVGIGCVDTKLWSFNCQDNPETLRPWRLGKMDARWAPCLLYAPVFSSLSVLGSRKDRRWRKSSFCASFYAQISGRRGESVGFRSCWKQKRKAFEHVENVNVFC